MSTVPAAAVVVAVLAADVDGWVGKFGALVAGGLLLLSARDERRDRDARGPRDT